MEWSDVLAAAGFRNYAIHNGGLEFHHLSVDDTLALTKVMQRNQRHLDDFLPVFSRSETRNVPTIQRWIRDMLAEQFPFQHFVFTWRGKLCGLASTLPITDDPRDIQLRYMVFDGFTGKGIATRIAKTLEIYGFHVWGFRRIFIEMDSHNRASMAVAQKLDYQFNGTKDYDLIGTKGTGFWFSYVKHRPRSVV